MHAEAKGKEIFSHGISALAPNNYVKISTDGDYENEIVTLIEIRAELLTLQGFVELFFKTCGENGSKIKYPEGGIEFITHKKRVSELKERFDNIINNIN